ISHKRLWLVPPLFWSCWKQKFLAQSEKRLLTPLRPNALGMNFCRLALKSDWRILAMSMWRQEVIFSSAKAVTMLDLLRLTHLRVIFCQAPAGHLLSVGKMVFRS